MGAWKMDFPGDGMQLARQLRALPELLTKAIVLAALERGAEPIRQRMSELAPRGPDAPHLADSMTVTRLSASRAASEADTDFAVAIGPAKDFFYGSFWEFGWRYHSAHPFMRPAFDEKAQVALQIIGQELWNGLRKQKGASGIGTSGTGNL